MHTKSRAVRYTARRARFDDEDELLPGVEDMPLGPKPEEQAGAEGDLDSAPGEQ